MLCLAVQLCLTLCNLMDYSLPGSSVHRDSPGKNPGVDFHALLRGIFPNQRSNMGLPHCRQILYHVSHQGSPRILEGSLYLLKGIFPTQELNQDLLHCRWILYQLRYQGSPSLCIALHKYIYNCVLIPSHETFLFQIIVLS